MIGSVEITKVTVVPYDPNWPKQFVKYSKDIRKALGNIVIRIEHIGSTAVPGCSAKPVIDIQVSVADVEDEKLYKSKLEKIGYIFKLRESGHVLFVLHENDARLVNLHICNAGSDWERSDLEFRDFLRASVDIVKEYSRLKEKLAEQYPQLEDYYNAKNSYLADAKQKARQWAKESGWIMPANLSKDYRPLTRLRPDQLV